MPSTLGLRSLVATALVVSAATRGLIGQATIPTAKFNPALHVNLKLSKKTPSGLYYRDIVIGKGAIAKSGSQVSVKYAGTLTDGTQFDATRPGAAPISFQLGQGRVIAGWEEGLTGMRAGGKRQLVIPSELGYGPGGRPPKIGPNAILVFTVELVAVH